MQEINRLGMVGDNGSNVCIGYICMWEPDDQNGEQIMVAKIMALMLQSLNDSIEIFVIRGIFYARSIELLFKISHRSTFLQ